MSDLLSTILTFKEDAIYWQLSRWQANATSAYDKANVIEKLSKLLASIPNYTVRQSYVTDITSGSNKKRFGITAKILNTSLAAYATAADEAAALDAEGYEPPNLPSWMDLGEIEEKGFCTVPDDRHFGYWSYDKNGKIQLSNFIINPIFHVAGKGEDSRHIFEIDNGRRKAVVDCKSKVLISVDSFGTELVAEGNFVFFGSNGHLKRIAAELLPHFPLCHEIRQHGWQREGFFAFTNHVLHPDGTETRPDRFGVFAASEKHFLIPAASDVYAAMREGEDQFKMLRSCSYSPAPITFRRWAAQMYRVYDTHGLVGIAFVLLTAFRDIIFEINHSCPHLYSYGERTSGKSTHAYSVMHVFFQNRETFNLNSGTEFAFFAYMQAFRNCPAHLNEFDDKVCSDERFQAIKGVFDGEGRMRGKMGSRNTIEVMSVDSTLILTGQYISTKDDNSVVSRSIVLPFAEKQYSAQDKQEYDWLTEMQKTGLTGLLKEVLALRKDVQENYAGIYSRILSDWRKQTAGEFNQRVFQNWCHLVAMWEIGIDKLGLPALLPDFNRHCYNQALHYSRFMRNSDTLTAFWQTVASLLDKQQIEEGWHFRIVTVSGELKLRDSDGNESVRNVGTSRRLLFVRLQMVHALYEEDYRRRTGDKAMSYENIKGYLNNRDYFIGQTKQTKFQRYVYKAVEHEPVQGSTFGSPIQPSVSSKQVAEKSNTSAYVFDYEILAASGIDLDRSATNNDFNEDSNNY